MNRDGTVLMTLLIGLLYTNLLVEAITDISAQHQQHNYQAQL